MTGAQFEIRIDGTPRSYRDRRDYAMERIIGRKYRSNWRDAANNRVVVSSQHWERMVGFSHKAGTALKFKIDF
jgi:hypothetical protein